MLVQRLTHRYGFLPLGFWIATLSSVFYYFAIQITFPIVPLFLENELGADKTFIGTSVLVVTIAEVLFRIPVGNWTDRFGRRQFMIAGALIGVLYPALAALSHNTTLFLLSRAAHGLSLAIYVTCSKVYIADIVPPDRNGEAQGINTSAFALALIFGPLTGEALKNAFDFRVAFWVGAAIATLAWLIILALPKEEARPNNNPSLWEGIQTVLRQRGGWASLLTALTAGNTFVIFFVYFPLYAEKLGLENKVPAFLSDFVISLAFILFAVGNLVALPMAGRYSDQKGRTAALIPGVIILIPSLILFALAKHYLLIYGAILLVSVGFSFFRAMMDALMQDACPRPVRGAGMAILFSIWSCSIGINSQFIGWIIDQYGFGWVYVYSILITILFGSLSIMLSRNAERDRATLYKAEFPPLPVG